MLVSPILRDIRKLDDEFMEWRSFFGSAWGFEYHLRFNEHLPLESMLLAISAAQQKDYSSLYYLLFSYPCDQDEKKIIKKFLFAHSPDEFPPIQAEKISSWIMDMRKELPLPPSIDLHYLNQLYKEILEKSDSSDIPIEMWHDRAYILFKLGEFDQAQYLYSKIIEEYEKQDEWNLDRFYAWIEMAHIKIHFNQLEEANTLYAQASSKLETILKNIRNHTGFVSMKAYSELEALLKKNCS